MLPRCFGFYEVCGERITSAEIEEVCVATATLPYQDYLDCRKLHLMISIFYNDGVFGGLLKFLRQYDISVYRWLEMLRDEPVHGPLGALIADFEEATRTELWHDRADLEAFVQQPGTIERYISGELGLNLLFTFKSIAMTRHIHELEKMARATAGRLVRDKLGAESERFVREILLFDACRMSNLFDRAETPVAAAFNYDIPKFLSAKAVEDVTEYEFDQPHEIAFRLDDTQRATIERGLVLFGRDDAGIGRILSKFHISRLLRRALLRRG